MRSTIRCAACSLCLTMLASPDSAWNSLSRARDVSPRDVLFSFFVQINCSDLKFLFVRIDAVQSECEYERKGVPVCMLDRTFLLSHVTEWSSR